MKVNVSKRMPKNKASKIEVAKNKRLKKEEERVVLISNLRKPSPSVKLLKKGEENKKKNHDNNSLLTPQMKYKENQVPKTLTEAPQIEEDTIGVRWGRRSTRSDWRASSSLNESRKTSIILSAA